MKSAVILFAHGSRDPDWAAPLRAVQQKVAARKREIPIELAFLEFMEPDLPGAVEGLVACGSTRITIAPIFIAQGAHLKRDLSRVMAVLREQHPGVELALLPALGEVDAVLDAISNCIAESVSPCE